MDEFYVIVDIEDMTFAVIDDSCGYPSFDDCLCPRTTKFCAKSEALNYIKNLGMSSLKIAKILIDCEEDR